MPKPPPGTSGGGKKVNALLNYFCNHGLVAGDLWLDRSYTLRSFQVNATCGGEVELWA